MYNNLSEKCSNLNILYDDQNPQYIFSSKDKNFEIIYPLDNFKTQPTINNNLNICSFIPNSTQYINKSLKFSFSKGAHITHIIICIDGNYKQPSVYSNVSFEIFTKLRCNNLTLYETSYKCCNLNSITNNDYNFNIKSIGIEKEIIINDNMSNIYMDCYININTKGELYKNVNINNFEYIIEDKMI
jgi:hypothetical protein